MIDEPSAEWWLFWLLFLAVVALAVFLYLIW